MGIFDGIKNRIMFIPADLKETEDEVEGPDRGWFHLYTYDLCGDYDLPETDPDPSQTLVLLLIRIKPDFRSRGADVQDASEKILSIIDRFYSLRKDIILRITYDTNGHALESEPYDLEAVLKDAEMVGEILERAGEKIFVYQGLLVGNWGEMHTSRYADNSSFKSIYEKLSGKSCYYAVRRPDIHRQLAHFGGKLGIFDDAIFGSESDMGTYMDPEKDVLYECEVSKSAPGGGEAVFGGGYIRNLSEAEILDFLKKKRVTYLNSDYDPVLLNLLREKGDLFGRISRSLGYRLVVRKAVFQKKNRLLRITVINRGFAPVYRKTESILIIKYADGHETELKTDLEPGNLSDPEDQAQTEADLSCVLDKDISMPVKIYLKTLRSFDGRVIRYANTSSEDGSVYIGELR